MSGKVFKVKVKEDAKHIGRDWYGKVIEVKEVENRDDSLWCFNGEEVYKCITPGYLSIRKKDCISLITKAKYVN